MLLRPICLNLFSLLLMTTTASAVQLAIPPSDARAQTETASPESKERSKQEDINEESAQPAIVGGDMKSQPPSRPLEPSDLPVVPQGQPSSGLQQLPTTPFRPKAPESESNEQAPPPTSAPPEAASLLPAREQSNNSTFGLAGVGLAVVAFLFVSDAIVMSKNR